MLNCLKINIKRIRLWQPVGKNLKIPYVAILSQSFPTLIVSISME